MDLIALEISGDDGAGWEFLAMGRKNTHRQNQIGSQKSMEIFTLKIQFRSSSLLRFQSLHLPNTKKHRIRERCSQSTSWMYLTCVWNSPFMSRCWTEPVKMLIKNQILNCLRTNYASPVRIWVFWNTFEMAIVAMSLWLYRSCLRSTRGHP